MFDDVNKDDINKLEAEKTTAKPAQPAAPVSPVEDIFSQTDKAKDLARPGQGEGGYTFGGENTAANQAGLVADEPGRLKFRRRIYLLLIIVIIAIIGVGGYLVYDKFFANLNPNLNFLEKTEEDSDFDITDTKTDTSPQPVPADSDNDGLFDYEEEEYGTDINLPDSDGDGLFDREEVKVYQTNPLDPDSDGDGYLDGEEVKSGYNPLGEGKLLPDTTGQ